MDYADLPETATPAKTLRPPAALGVSSPPLCSSHSIRGRLHRDSRRCQSTPIILAKGNSCRSHDDGGRRGEGVTSRHSLKQDAHGGYVDAVMKLHNHLNEVPGRLGDAASYPWCGVKSPLRFIIIEEPERGSREVVANKDAQPQDLLKKPPPIALGKCKIENSSFRPWVGPYSASMEEGTQLEGKWGQDLRVIGLVIIHGAELNRIRLRYMVCLHDAYDNSKHSFCLAEPPIPEYVYASSIVTLPTLTRVAFVTIKLSGAYVIMDLSFPNSSCSDEQKESETCVEFSSQQSRVPIDSSALSSLINLSTAVKPTSTSVLSSPSLQLRILEVIEQPPNYPQTDKNSTKKLRFSRFIRAQTVAAKARLRL
ncbi:hypothetical protein VNO77_39097 [Canavalia gladiata]|uniref:Uncharacterized protein n=1 Tax=Canavalia gladiata TaxID=3824 RepID=A0AAN9PZF4_CANGL